MEAKVTPAQHDCREAVDAALKHGLSYNAFTDRRSSHPGRCPESLLPAVNRRYYDYRRCVLRRNGELPPYGGSLVPLVQRCCAQGLDYDDALRAHPELIRIRKQSYHRVRDLLIARGELSPDCLPQRVTAHMLAAMEQGLTFHDYADRYPGASESTWYVTARNRMTKTRLEEITGQTATARNGRPLLDERAVMKKLLADTGSDTTENTPASTATTSRPASRNERSKKSGRKAKAQPPEGDGYAARERVLSAADLLEDELDRVANDDPYGPIDAMPAREEVRQRGMLKRAADTIHWFRRRCALYEEQLVGALAFKTCLGEMLEGKKLDLTKLKPTLRFTGKDGDATLVLLLSDLHAGALFDAKRNHMVNDYNLATLKRRTANLVAQFEKQCMPLFETGRVKRLIVNLGGDLIENRTMHRSQAPATVSLNQQMKAATQAIGIDFIARFAHRIPKIDVYMQPGNHGRIGDKGDFPDVLDSLDYTVFDMVRTVCHNLKNVHFWEPQSYWTFLNIHGWNCFFMHGDQGVTGKTVAAMTKALAKISNFAQCNAHLLAIGHFHADVTFEDGFTTYVVNGAWAGTGDHSSRHLMAGLPNQRALLVTKYSPVATAFNLMLEDPMSLTAFEANPGKLKVPYKEILVELPTAYYPAGPALRISSEPDDDDGESTRELNLSAFAV